MLKRNFILLSLVGLVLVISTTFEEENTDVEVLPNNENLDLSIAVSYTHLRAHET